VDLTAEDKQEIDCQVCLEPIEVEFSAEKEAWVYAKAVRVLYLY
jgi:hypothetical protein